MTTAVLTQPRRELTSLTAEPERRARLFRAARAPAAVGPDHLTALGLVAMLAAGAAYALSARWPLLLLAVNVALVLNWLGDSLDGTLARYRQRTRPRYGFYVDHMVDALGALGLLLGLAACGRGTIKISYGPFGGTELRILLALANTAVWLWPQVVVGGRAVMAFDVMGGLALLGLVAALVRSTAQNACALYALERL